MIPDAILLRIARLFLILAAALVFGVIFGIATDDKILLLLSIALAVTGGIKIGTLFFSARKREYEIVEGTVNSLRRIPVRKCCALTVTNGDGVEMEIIVRGRASLTTGKHYRLYLSREEPILENLPKSPLLQPARVLLGFEETLAEQ